MEARRRRCHRQERRTPRIEVSGSGTLVELEPIPPSKPRRNEPSHGLRANHCRAADALHEAAGLAPLGARLRPPGGRSSGAHRGPEWLHRRWHTCHKSRGINPSGERGHCPSADLRNRVGRHLNAHDRPAASQGQDREEEPRLQHAPPWPAAPHQPETGVRKRPVNSQITPRRGQALP